MIFTIEMYFFYYHEEILIRKFQIYYCFFLYIHYKMFSSSLKYMCTGPPILFPRFASMHLFLYEMDSEQAKESRLYRTRFLISKFLCPQCRHHPMKGSNKVTWPSPDLQNRKPTQYFCAYFFQNQTPCSIEPWLFL